MWRHTCIIRKEINTGALLEFGKVATTFDVDEDFVSMNRNYLGW